MEPKYGAQFYDSIFLERAKIKLKNLGRGYKKLDKKASNESRAYGI